MSKHPTVFRLIASTVSIIALLATFAIAANLPALGDYVPASLASYWPITSALDGSANVEPLERLVPQPMGERQRDNALLVGLSGNYNIPGDFADLQTAIASLNTNGVAGPVTFNVSAAQSAPAGGYVIGGTGSLVLTTTSSVNTVTLVGNASVITASGTLTSGALNDAIFKLIGADWITISGFTMQENPVNATTAAGTNNMTEWGVALLYVTTTDGAQNDTIQNNTITLNRTYQNTFGIYSNSTHSATAVTTSATATTTAGGNSGLKVYGNTISNVNNGVVVVGPTAAADANSGVDIGGAGGAQANSITNFGTTGTFSSYANVSGTVNGILVRNSVGFNASFNTIASSVGGTTTATLNGIQVPAASNAPTTTFTNNINSNNISLQSGLTTGALNGITYPSGSASATSILNVNSNNFGTFGHTVAGPSGAITFITVSSTNLTTSISSNTFTNISLTTTGSVTFISNSITVPAGGSQTINSNSIVTAFNKTGAGGTVTLFTNNGSSPATVTEQNNSNNFSNISVTGATTIAGWSSTDGGAPTKTVTGNTFSNWMGGTSAITGLVVSFSGSSTVSNNTISNITSAGAITGISSSSGTETFTQNTVHTLSSSGATTAVTGIANTGGTTKTYSRNKVYNLENTGGGTTVTLVNGFLVSTAATTINIFNNLIGDLRAPNASFADAVRGLSVTATTTSSAINASFNTIYLNATSVGANFGTSGIFHTASTTSTTATLTLRNNIVVNTSTPNIGGGSITTAAYRRSSGAAGNLANYGSASNNNLFYAGTPGSNNLIYDDGLSVATTIIAYKNGVFTAGTIAPRDSASFTENPPFLSTTGSSATFLHINTGVQTQIESGGAPVSGITDDFDGDTRNASTPDIGADEFAGTPLDLTGPNITYSPAVGNTSLTTNRTVTITVVDPSGVPTSGIGLPVIYYRKGASGAYSSTQCSFGGGSNYSCVINYALVTGGSVTAGDIINYYVAAQDNVGNVSINPSTGASGLSASPPAASTPPTAPGSYTIVAAITGTKTVCASGCDYASLTNAGGVFVSINAGVVTGTVNIEIGGDLLVETGANALNQLTEEPTGSNFTVKIYPTGVARAITGTSANGLITFNGVDNAIIDGSLAAAGTDRSLTITNTNIGTTSAVVWLQATAQNNRIQNLNIVGNGNTQTLFGVGSGSTTISTSSLGTSNNNNRIQNNNISKTQYGIFSQGASAGSKNTGNRIKENLINTASPNNVSKGGIWVGFENDVTISGNTVSEINQTSSPDVFGISLGFGTSMSSTTSSGNEVTNATVTGNTIGNIINSGTFSAYGIGLSAATSGASTIANNMIYGVAANGTAGDFGSGIVLGGGTGSITNVYYNSISMQGTVTGASAGTQTESCLAVTNSAPPTLDIRNNIFANTQVGNTGSTAQFIGVALGYTSTLGNYVGLTASNNNYFIASGAGYFKGSKGTVVAGTTFQTLPLWQAETGRDANSISANPFFAAASNLHIDPASGSIVNAAGTPIAINTDFDGETRDLTTPDIGADEFTPVTGPGTLQFSSTAYSGSENTTVQITVTRTGGNSGAVSVDYASTDGSATGDVACGDGADFASVVSTLNWANGDSAAKTFNVTLCADAVYPEGNETFSLTLSNATGSAVIGANNPATVTIIDVPPPLSGSYTVAGSGGDFASLTNAGGIFERLNTSGATGAVTINIASDLTSESGTVTLNELAGGFAVLIQPSGGVPRLVSGGSALTLIGLSGADNVTIDCLNSGGNTLTFRSTNASGATIRFTRGATNNTVRNCTIEGGNTSTTSGVIDIDGLVPGDTVANNNNTITGNTIRDRSDTSAVPTNLIYSAGFSGIPNSGNVISNNTLKNFTTNGIQTTVPNTQNWTISGNTILQDAPRTTTLTGIRFEGAGTNTITQNTIRDLTSSGSVTGILLINAVNTTVSRNRIYSIPSTSGSTSAISGIEFDGTSGGTPSVTVVNNMVSIVPSFNNSQTVRGIYDFAYGGNTFNAYFNTVLISGTAAGNSSWACLRGIAAPTAAVWTDNLCFNNRTGGTGNHFAMGDQSNATGTFASNYNIFVGTGATAANFFDRGTSSSGTPVDFAGWQAGGRDANSQASNPGGNFTVGNMFVSASDLHANPLATNPASNSGTPVTGVTVDFDGDTRNATTPDIGADEFTPFQPGTLQFSSATYSGAENSGTIALTVTRMNGTSGAVSASVTFSDNVATGGGACTAGVDYINTQQPVSFADGDATPQTVNVTICDDAVYEGNETFGASLTNLSGATAGTPSSATVTITENDGAPVYNIGDVVGAEGDSGGTTFHFTVTRTGSTSLSADLSYSTADGTATAPSDYTAVTGGSVVFPAGVSTIDIPVGVIVDRIAEADETFFVNLTATSVGTIGDGQGQGTILNDDIAGVLITQSGGSTNVTEGGATDTYTVALTSQPTSDVTITPSPDSQVTVNPPSLTFTAANWYVPQTITVTAVDDNVYEGDHTGLITHSSASSDSFYNGITVGSVTANITDNDPPPGTLVVTNTTDNGGICLPNDCSLRQAITSANANGDLTTINFNIPGSGVQTITPSGLYEALQPITSPVVIDGYSQPGAHPNTLAAGDDAVILIEISGISRPSGGCGLTINGGGSTVRGLAINRWGTVGVSTGAGIRIYSLGGNTITGNFIGTNAVGTAAATNNGIGIEINSAGNTIGGTTPADRNLISGNGGPGIQSNRSNNLVRGNFIGTNAAGTAAIGNAGYGVQVTNGAIGNIVGTGPVGSRNIISGNGGGVSIDAAATTDNLVAGNYIGTDVTGSLAIGNQESGVSISGGAHNNGVGGVGYGNVISGNSGGFAIPAGVIIRDVGTTGNVVRGNYVGVAADGTTALGNVGCGLQGCPGVRIFDGASGNTIGGTLAGEGNIIANSTGDGMLVVDLFGSDGNTTGNIIRGNSIYDNGRLGINLIANGENPALGLVTPNDAGDADNGPNTLQNFPVITSAVVTGSTRVINGTLNSTPAQAFSIDLYSNASCDSSGNGEGKVYLGSVVTGATDGSGNVGFTFNPATLTAGEFITATATDAGGNTSEFSTCTLAVAGSAGSIHFSSATYSGAENGGTITITATRTGGSDGAVSADFAFSDGSATGGASCGGSVDFVNTGGTFSWSAGDTADKTYMVPICNDSLLEPDETFNATLSNPTGGATIGSQGSAVVTIIDDETATISGRVAYGTPTTSGTKSVPGVTLTAAGTPSQTATTDGSGNYTLSGLRTGPYTVTPAKTGDINGISSLDAARVAQFAAGLFSLTANQQIAADVSNNGSISSLDAAQIARFIAGFNSNVGITGQWKFVPASRSYPSLSGNLTGENYDGILLGDVTGNWAQPAIAPEVEQPWTEAFDVPAVPDAEPVDGKEGRKGTIIRSGLAVTLPTELAIGKDGSVEVPVAVGETGGRGIAAYDLRISFDAGQLQPADSPIDTEETVSRNFTVIANTGRPGQMIVSAYGTSDLAGSGTLLKLRFRTVGTADSIRPLTWSFFMFNEDDASASRSIDGRVTTADGMGIRNATVTISGGDLAEPVTVQTGEFGYYDFDGIQRGQTYMVTVRTRRFSIAQPTRVITIADNVANFDFVAEPRE